MTSLNIVCGIVLKKDKILIARRSGHKSNSGKWEFPGGKIEPTEDPLGALKRELAEELQLNADNYQYLMTSDCVVNEVMIHLIAYQCEYISGATSSTDHDRIEWISGLELKDYTFTNPDIPIVQFIESQQVGF